MVVAGEVVVVVDVVDEVVVRVLRMILFGYFCMLELE